MKPVNIGKRAVNAMHVVNVHLLIEREKQNINVFRTSCTGFRHVWPQYFEVLLVMCGIVR